MPGKVTKSNPALRKSLQAMRKQRPKRPRRWMRPGHIDVKGLWASYEKQGPDPEDVLSDYRKMHAAPAHAIWQAMIAEHMVPANRASQYAEAHDWTWRTSVSMFNLFGAGMNSRAVAKRIRVPHRAVAERLHHIFAHARHLETAIRGLKGHPGYGTRIGTKTHQRNAPARNWKEWENVVLREAMADCTGLDIAVGRAIRRLGRPETEVRLHLKHLNLGTADERQRAVPYLPGQWSVADDARMLLLTAAEIPPERAYKLLPAGDEDAPLRQHLLLNDTRRLDMVRGFLGVMQPSWDKRVDILSTGQSSTVLWRDDHKPLTRDMSELLSDGHEMDADVVLLSLAIGRSPLATARLLVRRKMTPRLTNKRVHFAGCLWNDYAIQALRTWCHAAAPTSLYFLAHALGHTVAECIEEIRQQSLFSESTLCSMTRHPGQPEAWR